MLYALLRTYIPEGKVLGDNDIPHRSEILGVAYDLAPLQKAVGTKLSELFSTLNKDEYEKAIQGIRFGFSYPLRQFETVYAVSDSAHNLVGYRHMVTVPHHAPVFMESYEIVTYEDYKEPVFFVKMCRGLLEDVYTDIPGNPLLYKVITGEEENRIDEADRSNEKLLERLIAQRMVRSIQTSTQWFVTDDEFYQCCRPITDRVFELIQVCELGVSYGVARAVIDVDDYDIDDWERYLKLYGHEDLRGFIEDYHCELNLRILAEYIFETDWQEYLEETTYHTVVDAAKAVAAVVDCELNFEVGEAAESP